MTDLNGRLRISWSLLAYLVGLFVTALVTYAAMDTRVAILEVKYDRVAADLAEIKADIKLLLRRP